MKAKYPTITVRLMGVDKPLAKKIKCLAKNTGVSESKISSMAIRAGLPLVAENLEGLHIDLDCLGELSTTKAVMDQKEREREYARQTKV